MCECHFRNGAAFPALFHERCHFRQKLRFNMGCYAFRCVCFLPNQKPSKAGRRRLEGTAPWDRRRRGKGQGERVVTQYALCCYMLYPVCLVSLISKSDCNGNGSGGHGGDIRWSCGFSFRPRQLRSLDEHAAEIPLNN